MDGNTRPSEDSSAVLEPISAEKQSSGGSLRCVKGLVIHGNMRILSVSARSAQAGKGEGDFKVYS